MSQWSEKLLKALFDSGADIHDLSGLKTGMSGPEFEAALGLFLRRADAFAQVRDIVPLTPKVPGVSGPQIQTWYDNVASSFDRINDVIHASLIGEFHHSRLAVTEAKQAYGALLRMAGLPSGQRLVYATTNYDALGELALEELGARVDAGEPTRQYGGHATGLNVAGLLDGIGRNTPVLHLHGKSGWYRDKEGQVQVLDVLQHHPSQGVPVVMLPDPAKTYAGDDVLALLWAQFEEAVLTAQRVLVLGHSLHDDQLVKVLKRIPDQTRLAITFYGSGSTQDNAQVEWLKQEFGSSPSYYPVRFAAGLDKEWSGLAQWFSTGAGRLIASE
jgi:hypothetical protein